jgi:hypothetical protein
MPENQSELIEALGLMESALRLLDEAGGATGVGAYLDLAIHRLGDLLATESQRTMC